MQKLEKVLIIWKYKYIVTVNFLSVVNIWNLYINSQTFLIYNKYRTSKSAHKSVRIRCFYSNKAYNINLNCMVRVCVLETKVFNYLI